MAVARFIASANDPDHVGGDRGGGGGGDGVSGTTVASSRTASDGVGVEKAVASAGVVGAPVVVASTVSSAPPGPSDFPSAGTARWPPRGGVRPTLGMTTVTQTTAAPIRTNASVPRESIKVRQNAYCTVLS